jgi:hypothetical protein
MEIQNEKLTLISNTLRGLLTMDLNPSKIVGEKLLLDCLEDKSTITSEDIEKKVFSLTSELMEKVDPIELCNQLTNEIDFNLAAIATTAQADSYLKFVSRKIYQDVEELKNHVNYYEWMSSKTGPFLKREFEGVIAEGIPINTGKIIDGTPLFLYLDFLESIIEDFDNSAGEVIRLGSNALISNNTEPTDPVLEWRKVTKDPSRRIYLDKWIDRMRSVRTVIDDNKNLIISINAGEANQDDLPVAYFIEWANELTLHALPQRIFSSDIMIEIDNNILEFKTDRERDSYLEKISSLLLLTSKLFKSKALTHPEMLSENFNEMEQACFISNNSPVTLDYRQLETQLDKYSLQKFYINILIISETLEKIAEYAKSKVSDDTHSHEQLGLKTSVTVNNHKLVLFDKLGLFKPLYEKYYNHLGPSKFAHFIGTIIGVVDDEKGTFRKAVSSFIAELNGTIVTKPVMTDKANNTTDAYLTELGLINLI